MKTIFAKYSSSRLPKYQIVTKIVMDGNGKKYALKEALCEQAQKHIEDIYNHYELLSSLYDINLVRPIKTEEGVLFGMAAGRSLEHILLVAIDQNDDETFKRYIDKFLDFVDSMVTKRDMIFESSKEFESVFGIWKIDEPQDIIKIANIDMIFGNIFVDAQDNFTLIDYEWVFDFEVPKSYVVWRGLAIFSAYHSVNIDKFSDLYFTNNDYFVSLDDNFSSFVYGENRKYFLTPKVRKTIYFTDPEKEETIINAGYYIQLFFDEGYGYSEENSIKLSVSKNTEFQEFTFDLIDKQNIKALRLDPLNDCCVIEIENLHVKKENEIIDLLSHVHSNTELHYGKSYFFTTKDSQIYLNELDPHIFENASSCVVILRYVHTSKDALHVSGKRLKTELDQAKTELDQAKTELDHIKTSFSYKIINMFHRGRKC